MNTQDLRTIKKLDISLLISSISFLLVLLFDMYQYTGNIESWFFDGHVKYILNVYCLGFGIVGIKLTLYAILIKYKKFLSSGLLIRLIYILDSLIIVFSILMIMSLLIITPGYAWQDGLSLLITWFIVPVALASIYFPVLVYNKIRCLEINSKDIGLNLYFTYLIITALWFFFVMSRCF